MKIQRMAIAVTAINLLLMFFLLAQLHPAAAQPQQQQQAVAPMLRGRGLEIVDSLGRKRATISFTHDTVMNNKLYKGSVLLRLIDSKGMPAVKIGVTDDGAGVSFANAQNDYVQVFAEKGNTLIRVKMHDGREKLVQP